MARNDLTFGSNTADRSSYNTATITPGPRRLVLAFVMNQSQGAAAPAAVTPVLQGNGLVWEPVISVAVAGNPDRRVTCFRAMGLAPGPGAVTISFIGQTQSRCGWSIFEFDEVDTTGMNGSGAVRQPKTASANGTTAALNLDPLEDATRSIAVAGILVTLDNEPAKPINPGTGLQEIHEVNLSNPGGRGGMLQTQARVGGGQQVDWSWTGVDNFAAIAIEVKAAALIDDPVSLAKRFEPILFFHPDERFFPSDAKRYLESSALWRAEAPFDQKGSWGGKTAPFPRAPMIQAGQIAALPGEPSTLLGSAPDHLAHSDHEERFLDLAGWKDASGVPQRQVTATTQNTYSERDAIAKRYNEDDASGGERKLRESRFRYHAELFPTERLRRLLATVPEPDLLKVIDTPTFKNPALLCYYFFYPAHDEPLGAQCTNIEAREFGAFGGEWSCMALLLERPTPTDQFTPTLIGLTGRLVSPDPNTPALAQASDRDDAALRIVMKVAPFSSVLRREGEHPGLFVAKGTHSLYFDPGVVAVEYSTGLSPFHCGKSELSSAPIPQKPWPLEEEVLLGKLIGGSLAFGVFVGVVWALIEGISGAGGGSIPASDASAPDEVAQAGTGRTVKPVGLVVPGAGQDVEDWRSQPNEDSDGRKYNFIVDRERQVWWPSDSGESGYRGRWGPRVENDPLGRRAGMRFPTFWRMFFEAVAQGKQNGTL